ncbi:hypothetical protein TRICI_002742 [Trichomonascus ciferrii]|uniref:Uncharacterized protein n=1 Tax=Trichomonascus ciferrii TaxID=44093 RepID=A0A642VB13_9ASCO|nr:hypothetical protein TRICI_002742 [Trichomonascus ciferrii]
MAPTTENHAEKLAEDLTEGLQLTLEATVPKRRRPTADRILEARRLNNQFYMEVKKRKQECWNNFLMKLFGKDIWKARNYTKPQQENTLMPHLKKSDGRLTNSAEERADHLLNRLYPTAPESTTTIPRRSTSTNWPPPAERALENTPTDKAPGPDGIEHYP